MGDFTCSICPTLTFGNNILFQLMGWSNKMVKNQGLVTELFLQNKKRMPLSTKLQNEIVSEMSRRLQTTVFLSVEFNEESCVAFGIGHFEHMF